VLGEGRDGGRQGKAASKSKRMIVHLGWNHRRGWAWHYTRRAVSLQEQPVKVALGGLVRRPLANFFSEDFAST